MSTEEALIQLNKGETLTNIAFYRGEHFFLTEHNNLIHCSLGGPGLTVDQFLEKYKDSSYEDNWEFAYSF